MNFGNLSLRKKLFLSYAIGAVLVFFVGTVGVYSVQKVNRISDRISNVTLVNLWFFGEWASITNGFAWDVTSIVSGKLTRDEVQATRKQIDQRFEAYTKAIGYYERIQHSKEEMEIYRGLTDRWEKIKSTGFKAVELAETHQAANLNQAEALATGELRKLLLEQYVGFKLITQINEKAITLELQERDQSAYLGNLLSVVGTLFGFVIALLLGFWMASWLNRGLSELLKELLSSSVEVNQVAETMATSAEELSNSTTQQAAAVQQTSASLVQITAMVQKNEENSTKSSEMSLESTKTADEGHKVVSKVIEAIEFIQQGVNSIIKQIEKSNAEISDIVKVINEIGTKTKVINEIVFQTKLLSFNASVEAARAGEHGKGFAVVAEEVGNLAQMSGAAAKEISDLLGNSIQTVESIVNQTKSSVEGLASQSKVRVEEGAKIAKRCSEVLAEIVRDVREVASKVEGITSASKEQTQGISEINRAMTDLEHAIQRNSEISQSTNSTSTVLRDKAKVFSIMVEKLSQIVYGAESPGQSRENRELNAS